MSTALTLIEMVYIVFESTSSLLNSTEYQVRLTASEKPLEFGFFSQLMHVPVLYLFTKHNRIPYD